MQTIEINEAIATAGDGFWSETSKLVNVSHCTIVDDNLKAYFDKSDWDINDLGLIYSDTRFIEELKEHLMQHLPTQVIDSISYSEQGLQHEDYVDFDIAIG
jgi:hypothetical protein